MIGKINKKVWEKNLDWWEVKENERKIWMKEGFLLLIHSIDFI